MTALLPLQETDLTRINAALEHQATAEILNWVFSVFPKIALLTSGQSAGSVLAKAIYQCGKTVDMVFVDTLVLFPETLEVLKQISRAYQFPLKRYFPPLSMQEQTEKYGVLYLTHAGQEQCCHMRKVEPLQGIHEDYQVLLGPLRREEGGRRARVPIVSIDAGLKVVRVNPIAKMTNELYQNYLNEPDTIINPLHAQGYPTIGCTRCTTPVRANEPERAGRWRHLSGVDYCGINPTDFQKEAVSLQLPESVIQAIQQSLPLIEEHQ